MRYACTLLLFGMLTVSFNLFAGQASDPKPPGDGATVSAKADMISTKDSGAALNDAIRAELKTILPAETASYAEYYEFSKSGISACTIDGKTKTSIVMTAAQKQQFKTDMTASTKDAKMTVERRQLIELICAQLAYSDMKPISADGTTMAAANTSAAPSTKAAERTTP